MRREGRVAREVLEGSDEPFALEPLDVGTCVDPNEVRVFPKRFLYASPSIVPDDIKHWRQALVDAQPSHVSCDRSCHLLHEVGVEGRRPSDGRGIDRRAKSRQAGEALLMDDGRNAETRVLPQPLLFLSQLSHPRGRVDGNAAERSGEVTETVGDDWSNGSLPTEKTCCMGPTSEPESSGAPLQLLPSWASFSGRVMAWRSNSARDAGDSAWSCQGCRPGAAGGSARWLSVIGLADARLADSRTVSCATTLLL